MKLPNFSNMMYVGQIRYVQARYEAPPHRGPDFLAGEFLSPRERWRARLRGRLALSRLRRNPFYYYVLARTLYYDALFTSVIDDGFSSIMNIGCGSDTRTYRFSHLLRRAQVECFECDQEGAIESKEWLARRLSNAEHVKYLPIDLNSRDHGNVQRWLDERQGQRVLVMMEGVSPYLDPVAFSEFLELLGRRMPRGSRFAYDYKVKGIQDKFGSSPKVSSPFRLPDDAAGVKQFHERFGLQMMHHEGGAELVKRMIPSLRLAPESSFFREDVLLQFTV
jgi:methyltransferase (TIGR00027 family)